MFKLIKTLYFNVLKGLEHLIITIKMDILKQEERITKRGSYYRKIVILKLGVVGVAKIQKFN